MRKIERLMNNAITQEKDFTLDNTHVATKDGVSFVFLHGNCIAQVGDTWIRLFDGGWQTVTTKSRLNAILSDHGCPGERVFQKKGEWFVTVNGADVPFFSGMRLNWTLHYILTTMEEFSMSTTEMYQEIVEQEMADIFLDGDSLIVDDYSLENVIEEEYDIWWYHEGAHVAPFL